MANSKKNLLLGITFCCISLVGCNSTKPTSIMALTDANSDANAAFQLIQVSNLKAARSKIDQGIAADPTAPAPWYVLGYLEEVSGDEAKADTAFRKAIALAPESGPAHNNYGSFLCHQGRITAALKEFDLAVQKPRYYDLESAYENAGVCALEDGKIDQAKHYFLAAIDQNPYNERSLFELTLLSYDEKNYAKSRDYLNDYFQVIKQTQQPVNPLAQKIDAYLKASTHPELMKFLPLPTDQHSV